MIATAPQVYTIQDAVRSGAADGMTVEWLRDACDVLADQQIEIFGRLSENPGVPGNPGASLKQIEVQDAFLSHNYRIVAAFGANQCGKTEAVGGLCFCQHLRDYAKDGEIYWVIAQSSETVRDIPQRTIWKFLPHSMFPDDLEYQPKTGFGMIPTLSLRLPGGRGKCEVWFKTEEMDLKKFESARLNGVWWSECTRESLFYALQPRLAKNKAWMLMDYVPTEAWHRTQVQSGTNPHVYCQRFAMIDNAHNLPAGEVEYQRSMMPPEVAAVRIDGKDGAAFGVVIKEFKPYPYIEDGHIVSNTPIKPDQPCWVYTDVGKYTASLLLTVADDGRRYVVDEVYTLGLNVAENSAKIKEMLDRNSVTIDRVLSFKMDPAAWAYSAGNQVTVGEQYQSEGLPMVGWVRTATLGEEAMLQKMRVQFMHRALLVYERCEKCIMELQTWKHKTDRDGNVDPSDRYAGPNHTIDALKAWVAEDPEFSPPDYTPVIDGFGEGL